jgi:hypothetical protein
VSNVSDREITIVVPAAQRNLAERGARPGDDNRTAQNPRRQTNRVQCRYLVGIAANCLIWPAVRALGPVE